MLFAPVLLILAPLRSWLCPVALLPKSRYRIGIATIPITKQMRKIVTRSNVAPAFRTLKGPYSTHHGIPYLVIWKTNREDVLIASPCT